MISMCMGDYYQLWGNAGDGNAGTWVDPNNYV